MNDERFHFEIPKGNVRSVKYEKTGFSPTVPRANHSDHGKKLKAQTLALKKTEFNKKDSRFTEDLFLQIQTPTEVSLKSQRQKIEALGFDLLSYSTENKSVGTACIKKEVFNEFEYKLDIYTVSQDNIGKTYFAPIEDLLSIPVESRINSLINFESEDEIDIVINLYNVLEGKERLAIGNTIIEELKELAKFINQRTFTNGISSIECRIKAKFIPYIASEFSTIREIRTSQTFFVEQSIPAERIPNPLKVNSPESNSIICIIDSGVNMSNGIMASVVKDRVLYLPAGSVDCSYEHGTFVASRCVFGDNIDNCLGSHVLLPYCYLLDVPVFGVNATGRLLCPSDIGLRSAIEDIVLKYSSTIKVYNLSLGANAPIKDFEFSDIAKLLDFLSKKHKVLFVISAGNIKVKLGDFPAEHFNSTLSRISSPADSLLGLSVGSIAKYANTDSLSERNCVSPFSRIGPGADRGIKPEVVAHGGNLIAPYNYSPRISTYGISKDGQYLAVDVGTSHSAPIISQYAQRLFDLYPDSDPNLVKGLLCHFCDARDIHEDLSDPCLKYVGFGEPNIEKAVRAGKYNAAFIYEGQLDQENHQYIGFHIPSTLAQEIEDTKLNIKITITYDPQVEPDNPLEYSSARISAKLFKRTTDSMKPIDVCGDENYNLPWNPIIQFEKSFTRSYLAGQWELRLRLYTRGKVKLDYLQDYSAVIEIRDENEKTDVYSDILNEFATIYKRIRIKLAA